MTVDTISSAAPTGSTTRVPRKTLLPADAQSIQPRLAGVGSLRTELEALLAHASPDTTPEEMRALVLYHKLSQATLQKLRAQYAGGLIERLRGEQQRARERGAAGEVAKLQGQIEDVEEFRSRLEQIERGDDLRARIRCRWKDESETGRPGPYAPDIDDGVKVNIRPFQELGLLAVKEVIKKW